MSKVVAVVGSRKFKHLERVTAYVDSLDWDTIVISGGADGPDSAAIKAAEERGMVTKVFPVDKTGLPPYPEGRAEFRRRAYARNLVIAQECDEMVAFWDGVSGGTKHVFRAAQDMGKKVTVNLDQLDITMVANKEAKDAK